MEQSLHTVNRVTPPSKSGQVKPQTRGNRASVFRKPKARKRHDKPQESEVEVIATLLQDQPGGLSTQQERALGALMRRTPAAVKEIIEVARERLYDRLGDYTDAHYQATQLALADGDYKTVAHASQWAMENIGVDGVKVVDKVKDTPTTIPKVLIGIKLGGTGVIAMEAASVDAEAVVTIDE